MGKVCPFVLSGSGFLNVLIAQNSEQTLPAVIRTISAFTFISDFPFLCFQWTAELSGSYPYFERYSWGRK